MARIIHKEHTDARFLECNHEACLQRILYRIPKGMYGATEDCILTRNHEMVMEDGSLRLPENCGAKKVLANEISLKDGWFSVYHLRLDKDYHMIANGCLVTSLSSSNKPQSKKPVEETRIQPTPCKKPVCPRNECNFAIKNIS